MNDRERILLAALEVDSHSMPAGKQAIRALPEFGYMQPVGIRLRRWASGYINRI